MRTGRIIALAEAGIALLMCGACTDTEQTPSGPSLFGASVALADDILAVGAPGPGDNGVHVFQRAQPGTSQPWRHELRLAAPADSAADGFGRALAITRDADNTTLAIGAPGLVVMAQSSFAEHQRLHSQDDSGDSFGHSLALAGDLLAVGAPKAASGRGAVYVFQRSATGEWSRTAALTGLDIGDRFGASVALARAPGGSGDSTGSILVVGAPHEASAAVGVDGDASDDSAPGSGAAYAFRHNGTDWQIDGYIKAVNSDPGDHFGQSVAIGVGLDASLDDSLIVVGAPHEASASMTIDSAQADNSEPRAGAVYAYRRTPDGWQHVSYLKPTVPGAFEEFGHSVTVSGSHVAVLHGDYLHLFGTDADIAEGDPWAGAWIPAGLFLASFDDTRRYCRAGPGCLAADAGGIVISGRDLVAADPVTTPADADDGPDGIRAVYVYRSEAAGWQLDSALTRP